jgi:hypothetical protein
VGRGARNSVQRVFVEREEVRVRVWREFLSREWGEERHAATAT